MNSISWLIYWADVLPSVSTWVCIVSFFAFLGFSIPWVFGVTRFFGCEGLMSKWKDKYHDGEQKDFVPTLVEPGLSVLGPVFRRLVFIWPVFFILWGGSFLVPSKDTFYLIAGSEIGEAAGQTPEFAKVRKVLNKWLDGQLVEPKAEEVKAD